MPGPVSDSYDAEWGTAEKRDRIDLALGAVYAMLSRLLDNAPPMDIRELVDVVLDRPIEVRLHERTVRLLRFAVERARESL